MSQRTIRFSSARRNMALTVGVLAVAGASAASALASPAGPAARRGAAARPGASAVVPWSKAGPGWAVAEYSASSAPLVHPVVKGATTLYLTSPQGKKYPFYTWPASYTGPAYQLVDWSGDRQRVLVAAFAPYGHPNRLEQISLATGKVVSTFTLLAPPAAVSSFRYTRPSGLNLLSMRPHAGRWQAVRYNLAGQLQLVLTSVGISPTAAIDSPDGVSVIVGTDAGLARVSNTGGSITRFSAPVPVDGCRPVRWWSAGTVLAWCSARVRSYPRLWLFPVGGGKVTALTPQREGHGPDYGDMAAWTVSSHLDLQAEGPANCAAFIGQQWRDGTLHQVTVPTTTGNNRIVTALGTRLLVQAMAGICSVNSLLWFDQSTNAVQYVLHAPTNIEGVVAVVPYGRPSTS